jgi:hypothetical protein
MKTKLLSSLLIIGVSFFLLGNSMQSKDDKVLHLSDISSLLRVYQGTSGLDFVGDTIIYKEVGKVNYDNIFWESAVIYGTIAQVSGTVNGINNNTIPVDGEFAAVNIGFAVKDLPEMKSKIENLLDRLQKLNPKDDFKGMELKKAPKATEGINIARKQLTESASKLPKLLEDVTEISKKVIK